MGKFHTSKKVIELPPPLNNESYTFEELGNVILVELEKYRNNWTLKAVPYLDFDDIKMLIIKHIYDKFHQWDQSRSLFPWLHTAIRNQIHNALRDNYWNFQKPCVRCHEHDSFTNWCGLLDKPPCVQCPLYKKWVEKGKKNECDIQLPISINDERAQDKVASISDNIFDIEKAAISFHKRMEQVLTRHQYKIYRLFYIEGKTELEVAKEMGYKTTSHSTNKKRTPGYRWINMVVVEIQKKAKDILEKYGVEA